MTIGLILQKLSLKIEDAIQSELPPNSLKAIAIEFANIATLSDDDSIITNKSAIVLSIVNIEEDRTLKNQSLYRIPQQLPLDPSITKIEKYKKPAQNMVFSILFTAYNKDNTMYGDSIDKLEKVLRYLQNNNVFYYKDNGTDLIEQDDASSAEIAESNKIILDMISLKTDQINQMWSYLGSKYMPSILYTLRLIHIQKETMKTETIVKHIKIQLWENDKKDIAGEIESKLIKEEKSINKL